jgi:hypothetical protein
LFGGNGGLLIFTIGNLKYPRSLEGFGGLGGFEPPPPGCDG